MVVIYLPLNNGGSAGISVKGNQAESGTFAVDGGLDKIPKDLWSTVHWVGDGDSMGFVPQASLFKKHSPLPTEKDVSDYGYCLDLVALEDRETPHGIEVHGAFGGSFDHQWIAIQESIFFLEKHKGFIFLKNSILLTNVNIQIHCPQNTFFSLWSQGNDGHCTVTGARYDGEVFLNRPSHGLSNQTINNSLNIQLHRGLLGIFFRV